MERSEGSPTDVTCLLCKTSEETKMTGPLSSKQSVSAHQNCLLYASGICCKYSPTYDDLFGFDVDDVTTEYRRGMKLTCHYCKKKGATAGCEISSCRRSFHYPCARESNATPRKNKEKGSYKLYCEKHRPAGRPGPIAEKNGQHHNLSGRTSSGVKILDHTTVHFSDPLCHFRTQYKKRKREYVICSDSDEAQTIDPILAPLESDVEDNTPPKQHKHSRSVPEEEGDRGESTPTTSGGYDVHKRKRGGDGDETDIETGAESPSMLQLELLHENMPVTVIMDSGPSIDSENSFCCNTSPGPAVDDAVTLHTNTKTTTTITTTNLPEAKRLPFYSPSPGGAGTADPSGSPNHSTDSPLNLRAPPPPAEGSGVVGAPDSTAALFWRSCNEMGCTETIFGELTEQLISLAERVQTQHATQQDYNTALKILEASGKLPEIFRQQEQVQGRVYHHTVT
ncbi:hypothetical protein P4O66_008228 [Electrophorus voltai]|uniref:PHD-type domain-containing protein n=1 Tax=Electrophorus voltai TaxID=2609070 RepID=A0AAD9E0G4_9TELE|nr:hypothetical protein P4O66_008228 [Electrophorus voltai]